MGNLFQPFPFDYSKTHNGSFCNSPGDCDLLFSKDPFQVYLGIGIPLVHYWWCCRKYY